MKLLAIQLHNQHPNASSLLGSNILYNNLFSNINASSLLGSNILYNNLFSNINPCSSLWMRVQFSQPH